MIQLDGATGEGGGQILRSALTLSMITGQPFCISNIRANRAKPGLMRQHLMAVQSAAHISDARVSHAEVGSTTLTFTPGKLKAGTYEFAIGTAGSCNLVLQTLIPALLCADGPSTVRVSGGTHNPMAPPAQFLQRAYCRALASMGAEVEIELLRSGFYPAGGGLLEARISPCGRLGRIELMERGALRSAFAESIVAGIPGNVARRELDAVGAAMGWPESQLLVRGLPADQGPGNALLLSFDYDNVTEVFSVVGEKRRSSEDVAEMAMTEARAYLASTGAVGEHLADQLLLPMAIGSGGRFTTAIVSQHALTNAHVIGQFLPASITFERDARADSECHIVTVAGVA